MSTDGENANKKRRATKKGTAQKVKKATPRPRESFEEVDSGEEQDEAEEKEKRSSKIARSRSKSVLVAKNNKANEAKKLNSIRAKNDDGKEEEEEVEMGFDQA